MVLKVSDYAGAGCVQVEVYFAANNRKLKQQ